MPDGKPELARSQGEFNEQKFAERDTDTDHASGIGEVRNSDLRHSIRLYVVLGIDSGRAPKDAT